MSPGSILLSAAEFGDAFPFHFALDGEMRVVQFGRHLPKLCPGVRVGIQIEDILQAQRPQILFAYPSIRDHVGQLFLFRSKSTGALLRGQMILKESGSHVLFLGAPWFTDASDVIAAGLGLGDFAIHDPGMDMLLAMHAQKTAVGELHHLTERLLHQRNELRNANRELQERNEALSAAQLELRRNEKEIRLLGTVASRTDNAVVITDDSGRTIWVNEGYTRITGYSLEEARGRTPGSLLQGPETNPEVVEFMRAHIRDRKPFQAEVLNYSKSGRQYWVHIEARPIYDDDGALTHYLAIERDTTEQRRAEAALRAEKDMLGATLNSIVDGVIVVDPAQRVQLLNPAAEKFVGLVSAEAFGRPITEVFHPQDGGGAGVEGALGTAFSTHQVVGDIHSLESMMSVEIPGERRRQIVVSAVPIIDAERRVTGGLVVFRDVSAEVDGEQMKEDFVHAVSHELRTPLTSICGFVDLMLQEPEMPPDRRSEFLGIIGEQASRLHVLVNDILEISRIESGAAHTDAPESDLRQVALASLQEVCSYAQGRDVLLDWSLAQEPLPVSGDPVRLQSVVTNLLTNAIKFTPSHGKVQLLLKVESGQILLQVKDNGLGIPAEALGLIFRKFYRVPRPGTQMSGTGLGLAIVQSIVQQLKGRIEVESQVGAGSCFKVYLPLSEASGSST